MRSPCEVVFMMVLGAGEFETRILCAPLADSFGRSQLRHIERTSTHENKVIIGDHADKKGL